MNLPIRKGKMRVYAAWLAAIFLFVSSRGAEFSWTGILLALVGLGIRIWASGHLQKNKTVISSGPYAYTRNPLYLGSFIMGVGFFIAVSQYLLLLILIPVFTYLYYPVILDEERILEEKFGSKFEKYKKKVPLIIPNFKLKEPPKEKIRFSWSNVYDNKEYNALIGFVLALAIIFLIKSL